ncbi:MAG: NAD(P)-dependent oxidoreductase [Rothia sp. (in: high G+C Gram-positive bacteria)]|nr:NAD(P)-dependent oxidoreductase [Rothia sp. (in: high G+C Gram-positive bacteria)]
MKPTATPYSSRAMLPVALHLSGRAVLVVGGGVVALRRVRALLEVGARVRVVAQQVLPELKALIDSRSIDYLERTFEPADVQGVWVVFAHTDSAPVNDEIAEFCESAQIFCAVGAQPQRSSLWMMAHQKVAAETMVAVSSFGNPKRSQKILAKLTRWFAQVDSEDL